MIKDREGTSLNYYTHDVRFDNLVGSVRFRYSDKILDVVKYFEFIISSFG